MAGARPNLFKWNRQTNPRTHSSRSDVQDWIKRVERASSEAAREVFGNNYQSVLEQVHVDDDALVEGKAALLIHIALYELLILLGSNHLLCYI